MDSEMAIEQMSETPKRGSLHRRSHSDTAFRLPNLDDLLLFDPSDLDLSALPSVGPTDPSPRSSAHFRSLSVDSDFFDGLSSADKAEPGLDGVKKAMPPDRLAELALIDPKRAKRFFFLFIYLIPGTVFA